MARKFSIRTVNPVKILELAVDPLLAIDGNTRNSLLSFSDYLHSVELDLSTFRLTVEPNKETGMMEFYVEVHSK